MKKVLIALDYNPTAQKVAEAGYALAKDIGASVILLHVVSDPLYYSSMEYSPIMGFNGYMGIDALQPDIYEGLRTASQEFLKKTKLHLDDERIEILVQEGEAAEMILENAQSLKVDLIVMGTHSRKWLEAAVMGRVAEKVLHHSTVPLFIIPTKKAD